MGCIAEIVYGDIECNGDCNNCHWRDKDGTEQEREARKNDIQGVSF